MAEEEKKPRHGGRAKGTPNKRTSEIRQKAEELGVDPFIILLLYAKRDWQALGFESGTVIRTTSKGDTFDEDRITAKMQLDAAAEACQYLEAKRKAIEHSGSIETPKPEMISDDELDALIEEKLKGPA